MITFIETKFSLYMNYETLNRKELANLSITARDLFHFIIKFDKLHDIHEDVTVYFIGD